MMTEDKIEIGKIFFETTPNGQMGKAFAYNEKTLKERIKFWDDSYGIQEVNPAIINTRMTLPCPVPQNNVAWKSKITRLFMIDVPNFESYEGVPIPQMFTNNKIRHNSWLVVTEMWDEEYSLDEFMSNILEMWEEITEG